MRTRALLRAIVPSLMAACSDAVPASSLDAGFVDASVPESSAEGGSSETGPSSGCTSPYDTNPNDRGLYWGSLHEHTSWSLDAYFAGNLRMGPAEAYQFARGDRAYSTTNGDMTISHTPRSKLDWVAITDHSEFFDTQYGCIFNDDTGANSAYNSAFCAAYRKAGLARQAALGIYPPRQAGLCNKCPNENDPTPDAGPCTPGRYDCDALEKTMWEHGKDLANAYNDTQNCSFVTLRAFEYSSNAYVLPSGKVQMANMHRNVIFRDDNTTAQPLDYLSYGTPEDMWAALDRECLSGDPTEVDPTGTKKCRAISIPHNPNDSAGQKWTLAVNDASNRLRARFETLVEIHQHKGSSECLNATPTGVDGKDGFDAWCEFELATTLSGETNALGPDGTPICYNEDGAGAMTGKPCRKTDTVGYVRAGLGKGLVEYSKMPEASRYNPLKLGISASLDTHNGTPGYVSESSWAGHVGDTDDTPEERTRSVSKGPTGQDTPATARRMNPGGLTAVWAKHKRREDIFDALAARETYATSGTKIVVSYFQVWDSVDWCEKGAAGFRYDASDIRKAGGIPMGSTMSKGASGAGPRFVVRATKDPAFQTSVGLDAHNLLELNLVQTTVDMSGAAPVARDSIFRATATDRANGDVEMCHIFSPGDVATDGQTTLRHDPAAPSLWYARVLETASYSWRYYDCHNRLADNCDDDIRGTRNADGSYAYDTPMARIHERAWTSPIWYLP